MTRGGEAAFQQQVIDYARTTGWRVAHFRAVTAYGRTFTPVVADGAGWPDLAMVRRQRLVFAELKRRGKRRVRTEQRVWLDALDAVPMAEVYVWNPIDWPTIEKVLR